MTWLIAIVELLLMVWFVVVGVEAMILRVGGFTSPFVLREFHHAYLGVALVVVGLCCFGVGVQLVGLVLTIDDVWQHHVQTVRGKILYESPLHRLFELTLWKLRGVSAVVSWLDDYWIALGVLGLFALWIFT